jgi:hypothetical protein
VILFSPPNDAAPLAGRALATTSLTQTHGSLAALDWRDE